ncbi:unnamed protein product [Xylocopa violacea]|uniref:Uncharacterized protein n=1 Tax=Xylocopa violacea TaxID=135666 RepID=A0ABP1N518_XYLVO
MNLRYPCVCVHIFCYVHIFANISSYHNPRREFEARELIEKPWNGVHQNGGRESSRQNRVFRNFRSRFDGEFDGDEPRKLSRNDVEENMIIWNIYIQDNLSLDANSSVIKSRLLRLEKSSDETGRINYRVYRVTL